VPDSDAPPAETADSGDGAVAPDAPTPRSRPPIYRRRQLAGVAGAAAVVTALSLLVDSAFGYGLLHSWLAFSILGLGFYLVFGVSGQFAFSQGAFFGLGAYTSVWASEGRSFAWGLVAAIAVTAVVALVFALVVVRSDHFYFAIATLAFSHIALVVFREFEAFTAPGGEIVGIPKPDLFGHSFDTGRSLALFLGGFLVLALLGVALVERSPLRREAIAFRDNREVAATLGVPVLRLRLGMYVLGSTYAGVAGCLFAHRSGFISPESFALQLGIDIFLIVLLGGVGSMWGPALGAAFVVWAPEQLRFVDEYRSLIYGALLVVVIVAFPKGLVGVVELVWDRLRRLRGRARSGVAPAGERA
jgi:branched-chain amino acid transport system permease protein